MICTLTDPNGQRTLLQFDDTISRKLGGLLQFNGQYVTVQGTWTSPSHADAARGSSQTPSAVLNVISISITPSTKTP